MFKLRGEITLKDNGLKSYLLGKIVIYRWNVKRWGWDTEVNGKFAGCPFPTIPCNISCGAIFPEWKAESSFSTIQYPGQERVMTIIDNNTNCPCDSIGMNRVMERMSNVFPEIFDEYHVNQYIKNMRLLRKIDG